MMTSAGTENIVVLRAEDILSYFLGTDDQIDTLILCRPGGTHLVTTDRAIYEALGSIKSYDRFQLPRLVKLFESARVNAELEKSILTHERVECLRKAALSRRQTLWQK